MIDYKPTLPVLRHFRSAIHPAPGGELLSVFVSAKLPARGGGDRLRWGGLKKTCALKPTLPVLRHFRSAIHPAPGGELFGVPVTVLVLPPRGSVTNGDEGDRLRWGGLDKKTRPKRSRIKKLNQQNIIQSKLPHVQNQLLVQYLSQEQKFRPWTQPFPQIGF